MERLCNFLFLLTAGSSIQDERPIVQTELGTVRGYYKYSHENRLFAAFEGIPYAKPPIGNLRFAEPENAEPWSEILDTTTLHECAQHIKPDLADENEDCLYLNVYVPRRKPNSQENLDVIVHIHGGAFMIGAPSHGGPEFLMDKDVIYVNLNYRLGLFGFLSTGDDVVPGNNGLKDQVLALKWVKSNIQHFGGNPDSVTLTGVSAGGSSVHFHYFSNLSKGLFHKGISHSGTAIAPYAIYVNPLENTLKVSESVGCTQSLISDVVQCLKTKTANELAKATFSTYVYFNFPVAPFAPVIEKPSKTAFLTEHPYKLLEKGSLNDVPWISSITSAEGLLIYFCISKMEDVINKWHECSPFALNYFQNIPDVDRLDVTKKIIKYYFDDGPIIDDGIIKAMGDQLFKIPMEKSVEMQAKVSKSPVYSYMYSYENEFLLQVELLNRAHNKRGANHATDGLLAYYPSRLPITQMSENDDWVKSFLVNTITSFAKNGVPKLNGINWEPVSTNEDWGYLHIQGRNSVAMDYNIKDSKLLAFWNSLACDYWNRKPNVKDEF